MIFDSVCFLSAAASVAGSLSNVWVPDGKWKPSLPLHQLNLAVDTLHLNLPLYLCLGTWVPGHSCFSLFAERQRLKTCVSRAGGKLNFRSSVQRARSSAGYSREYSWMDILLLEFYVFCLLHALHVTFLLKEPRIAAGAWVNCWKENWKHHSSLTEYNIVL